MVAVCNQCKQKPMSASALLTICPKWWVQIQPTEAIPDIAWPCVQIRRSGTCPRPAGSLVWSCATTYVNPTLSSGLQHKVSGRCRHPNVDKWTPHLQTTIEERAHARCSTTLVLILYAGWTRRHGSIPLRVLCSLDPSGRLTAGNLCSGLLALPWLRAAICSTLCWLRRMACQA